MILYFSGTGNSYWLAQLLAEATDDGVLNIAGCLKQKTLPDELTCAERVGVVFPIHAWYAPRVVADFLSRLHLPHCRYRYAVCTCGDDVGKGMNRLAKHFPLDAAWSVQMPNTYIPMFSLDADEVARQKINEARLTIKSIADGVLHESKVWKVQEGSAAWLKTYVVNPLFVRHIIHTRGFHVDTGCISCGICRDVCPMGNIRMSEGGPVWEERCIHCMACVHACPRKVIQYGRSTSRKGRYRLADYL